MKKCLLCGSEFRDNTLNQSKKFCSVDCRKKWDYQVSRQRVRKSRAKVTPWNQSKAAWKMPEICKSCYYRKGLYSDWDVTCSSWDNTYCSFLFETGEVRGCVATDTHCERYLER